MEALACDVALCWQPSWLRSVRLGSRCFLAKTSVLHGPLKLGCLRKIRLLLPHKCDRSEATCKSLRYCLSPFHITLHMDKQVLLS